MDELELNPFVKWTGLTQMERRVSRPSDKEWKWLGQCRRSERRLSHPFEGTKLDGG